MTLAYCMKCRKKREMDNPRKEVKKGRNFMMGKCSKCGTKMALITK